MRTLTFVALTLLAALGLGGGPAGAVSETPTPPHQDWRFNGIFGTFDRAAAQRGLQVYREVCAACHSLSLISFRNLTGIGYSQEEIAALASQYQVEDGPNDSGEMFRRPAIPSDRFPAPFANEAAARNANNGAYPPDLSLIVDARPHGADYLYAFLTGFEQPPPNVTLAAGMNYNAYFPGHQVAMPNILTEGGVTYTDGTTATVRQQAADVSNFLMWASEPNMEERKRMGVRVVLFLVVFSGIMYAVKRKVWADAH